MKILDIKKTFGYIGIALFAFEGNGVVLNLRAASKNKQLYPKILTLAVICAVTFQLLIGFLGYSTYIIYN